MKIKLHIAVLAAFGCLAAAPTHAASLLYDTTNNPGWGGATAWSGGAWVNGSTAEFNPTVGITVSFPGSATYNLAGMTVSGNSTTLANASTASTFQFSGGDVSVANGLNLFWGNRFLAAGNFTKTGLGVLQFNSVASAAYVGTATINGGSISVNRATHVGNSSDFTVNSGGRLVIGGNFGETGTIGDVTVNNGGAFELGAGAGASTTTVSSLSGQSGATMKSGNNTTAGVKSRTLIVDQAADTVFSGTIQGYDTDNFDSTLTLTKKGAGNLTLNGDVGGNMGGFQTTTTVEAGGLFINTATTDLGDGTVATAINVTGGTLGGFGTIKTTGGSDVVVGASGKLAPGALNTIGKLTFDLQGTGGLLDLSAIGIGSLQFQLGAHTTAGTTYDQIAMTAGQIALGTLDFSDFAFSNLAGFGAGTYTLFDTVDGFTGGLETDSGLVGTSGLTGTLSISGNDLLLTVVPEPSAALYLVLGMGLLATARRWSRVVRA